MGDDHPEHHPAAGLPAVKMVDDHDPVGRVHPGDVLQEIALVKNKLHRGVFHRLILRGQVNTALRQK